MTRGEAANQCGVSRETVRKHMRADSAFAKTVSEAEMNANEAVEEALYQAALSGNVTACLAWLYSRVPDRWKDNRNKPAPPAKSEPAKSEP